MVGDPLPVLLREIEACRLCAAHLPLGPRPVIRAAASARILVIGQAPGTKVHRTGIPFNDPSGDRLRDWMGIDRDIFYDESRIAIMPMGLCYPGRNARGGDAPPRPECAPLWHDRVRALLPEIEWSHLHDVESPFTRPRPRRTAGRKSRFPRGPWWRLPRWPRAAK